MALEVGDQRAEVRRAAEFHPSVWGDYFLKITPKVDNASIWSDEVLVLKEEVRRMLTSPTDEPSQKLNLVHAVQRLGIAYHFETEINNALQQIFANYQHGNVDDDDELYMVALRFRLLRQHGYNVSSDIFNKFKDGKGNFKENLINDVKGMLSLYEASYLSVHGEESLDEALAFTKSHLSSMVTQLSSPLADQVTHALKWPLRRGLLRKDSLHYFSLYEQEETHNESLLRLGKLEFNIVQQLHQKELSVITKWWIGLDFATKLPFARDRLIECYFWALGGYPEPEFVLARRFLTKTTVIVSIIDDIYDAYGTIEELELFTKVIDRWDVNMKDELPNYMKICFEGMLDAYAELEAETTKDGKLFYAHYAKEALKNQVKAYMTEARWLNKNYVPTLEEYLSTAKITAIYPMLTTTSLCGMGEIATKEVFDWLFSNEAKILDASSTLARLIDDIYSHEFEQTRGHVASAVECYMKQHGVSKEQAHGDLSKQVESYWKDLNAELLKQSDIPMSVRVRIFNFASVIDVVFKEGDGYTNSKTLLKDILTALLVHPVVL